MTQAPREYRFGRFMLNPQGRELVEDGRPVALAPKVLDALLWLFEHRERAVGRDELGAAIWGKTDFTDGQLDQLIWGLRRALGDSGSEKNVIRTVPRFGYRWVADVEAVAPADDADTVSAASGEASEAEEVLSAVSAVEAPMIPTARSAPRRAARFVLGVLVLLAVAATAWALYSRHRTAPVDAMSVEPAAAPAMADLVAVLPVAMDAESDSQWAWLRLGLMDLLAARLIEGGVHVVPPHNIVALMGDRGALPDADRIREVTGATIVIAPTINRTSDGWRLRLDLTGLEGAAREIEVHESEPTATARQAADRVLVMMNRAPVTGLGEEHAGEDEMALRIDAAVASERFDIAQQLLDEVPAALRRAPRIRFMGVHVLLQQGRTAEALAELEALAGADGNTAAGTDLRSSILQGWGAVLARSGHPTEALKPLDAAVDAAGKGHSAGNYGSALQSRAAVNTMLGRWPEADADFAQARVALEMIGDNLGLAELESDEAGALINRQRYAEAAALQARAIERLERFPAGEALRVAYGNKIAMELDLLDTPAALATAARALESVESTALDQPAVSWLAVHVSRAEIVAGRLRDAERRLLAVRAGLDPAQEPDRYSNTQLLLAQLALARGDAVEAARLAAHAEELRSMPALAAAHFAKGRSNAALLRVHALLAQQRTAEARKVLHSFARWADGSANPDVVARLRLAQALVSDRDDSPEAAARHFDAALDAASTAAPATLARVAIAYGTHLLDAGETGPAARVIGRVARWFEQDFDCALLQTRLYHVLGQVEPWRRALAAARRLAGERRIPPALAVAPAAPGLARGFAAPASGGPSAD